jgi:hypothetical protein
MSQNVSPISRQLAHDLRPGEHRLSNGHLRDLYGLGRVTANARARIAAELHEAGLEVLSDPAHEPLVVRKTARAGAARSPRAMATPWWKRRWVWAVAGVVALLMIIGGASDNSNEAKDDAQPAAEVQQEPAETTTEAAELAQTLEDAEQAVGDNDYSQAVAIAAVLGKDDENRIRRSISRRLARRTIRALAAGDRGAARRLLRQASRYPTTAQTRQARASYRAAKARAAARAAERRRQRALARQRERDRRAAARARRDARERQQRQESAPSQSVPAGTCDEVGITDFPVEPGDPRDRDADGIACES